MMKIRLVAPTREFRNSNIPQQTFRKKFISNKLTKEITMQVGAGQEAFSTIM